MHQISAIKSKRKMFLEEKPIKDFEDLQKKVRYVIKHLHTEKKELYTYLGMARTTFDRKLENRMFTISEMYQLCEYFNKLDSKIEEEFKSDKTNNN